jgi:hypothetical protein
MSSQRLLEVVEDIERTILELIRKHQITHEEYRAATDLIIASVNDGEESLLFDVFFEAEATDVGNVGRVGSPAAIEGPFYIGGAPRLQPPYVMPRRPDERGEPLVFRGTVSSTEGVRLAGAELDWDTANIYSFGASEEIVGRAIRKFTRRDDIVRATKVHQHMHDGPGGSGLSRKAIIEQVDASLSRLGTDYIDVYQIHRFDPETPVEETTEALHDVIKAGKARYLGASSMFAWQFAKLLHVAELHGWTRFVSMQDQYNPVQRGEEQEMFRLLDDQGVGSIPWSPLAGGVVARP